MNPGQMQHTQVFLEVVSSPIIMGHTELRSVLAFGWLLSTMDTNCESLEISQTDRGI